MAESSNPASPNEAVLEGNNLKALRALAERPRPKSLLAAATFGMDSASTRSMMSRLSASLVRSGLAREKKSGRERLMEITDLGRAELRKHPTPKTSSKRGSQSGPNLQLSTALESDNDHEKDRPRFHLRHGALLALWKLRKRPNLNANDLRYERMLLSLATEMGTDAENLALDSEVFGSLDTGWDARDRRKLLMETLVRFQDVALRRQTGPELVALGDKIDSEPEAILWASAAIELAHHYSFAAASQVDRLTARRLLQRSKALLLKARDDPELRVAADYRLAKAAKVASVGWTSASKDSSPVGQFANSGDPEQDLLAEALNGLDRKVRRADLFNRTLEGFDRTLSRHIGRWIMLALPSTEWIFRRAGGSGVADEIHDWAVEMHERGTLKDLLVSQVDANDTLKRELAEFTKACEPFRKDFPKVVEPHLVQAQALLGKPIATDEATKPRQKKARYYSLMLLNNLWNPEMVAAHCIADVATPKENV